MGVTPNVRLAGGLYGILVSLKPFHTIHNVLKLCTINLSNNEIIKYEIKVLNMHGSDQAYCSCACSLV